LLKWTACKITKAEIKNERGSIHASKCSLPLLSQRPIWVFGINQQTAELVGEDEVVKKALKASEGKHDATTT